MWQSFDGKKYLEHSEQHWIWNQTHLFTGFRQVIFILSFITYKMDLTELTLQLCTHACLVTKVVSDSFVILWTVARQAPLSLGFSRKGYWSGLPCPLSGDCSSVSWGLRVMWLSCIKNLPTKAGDTRDTGSIPGSGRSSGEGNGNPLQYSHLGNPMTEEPDGL